MTWKNEKHVMTTVTAQQELDQALADKVSNICIKSPRGVWLKITDSGSASVEACGSASVSACDSATVRAGKYVAIHLHSQRVTHTGGVIIDMTNVDPTRTADWINLAGATVTDGKIRVFKAVNDTLESAQHFAYPIGEHVADTKWHDDHDCGNGLHFSPSPAQARDHFRAATRFLACDVLLSEVRCIDATKLKAPQAWVISEVDIHGHELVTA